MGVSSNTSDGRPGQGEGTGPPRETGATVEPPRPAPRGRADPGALRDDETVPAGEPRSGQSDRAED